MATAVREAHPWFEVKSVRRLLDDPTAANMRILAQLLTLELGRSQRATGSQEALDLSRDEAES
jgi:hypothetical protein